MRRSGAPSQLHGNVEKRPRFVPPGPHRAAPDVPSLSHPVQHAVTKTPVCQSPVSGALARVLNVRPRSSSQENTPTVTRSDEDANTGGRREREENCETAAPLPSGTSSGTHPDCGLQATNTPQPERYFSVVWCKASSRKHKRWEGDAVLVAKGRSVVLKDMEGKDIGRGSGYKASELESLCEGQTLMVSGKQIEVMGVVATEDYARGRCFTDVGMVPTDAPVVRPAAKPFSQPAAKSGGTKLAKKGREIQPRHDPHVTGALVMPRPAANHQWLYNKAGLPLVDVVVDPHLTKKLRPHQREGVVFLYECIMGMRQVRKCLAPHCVCVCACARVLSVHDTVVCVCVCVSVLRLTGHCGAILADEMGLGKTLQCVCALWTLLRQGPYGGQPVIGRAVVVAPGSLVKNWAAEFTKWLGRERIKVYTVDQDHRVEDYIPSPLCPVLVLSYEMVLRSLESLKKFDFGVLICDEGHRLKNTNIKTSSALHSLSCPRRVILTVEFVNPGILGSAAAYRKIYEEPIIRSRQPTCTQEERCLGDVRASELSRLTGVFTLRRTQDIIGRFLPERVEWTLFCRPTLLQSDLYTLLLDTRAVRACLSTHTRTQSPHLACISALKKLCNHPGLLYQTLKDGADSLLSEGLSLDRFPDAYSSRRFIPEDSGKLLVLRDLLSAINHINSTDRVVLVSNYTQTLDLLQDVCTRLGYSCCRLDGSTPVAKRQSLVDSFNSPHSSHFLFLLSSKAGGVGLNLVGASHLVLYDIDWNPANDIQAMARVWRDGQKKNVHIYRLLTTGTIEERIYQRQVCKQGLSGAVVDLGKGAEHISFSVEELRDLFTFNPDTPCLTHTLLGCHCPGEGQAPGMQESPVPERGCQLGRRGDGGAVPQRVSMSELMHWRHHSGTVQSYGDVYLDHAHRDVTYAFQSSSSETLITA
ncbi:DNA repair and recombination protein RAD54B isoform X2 [Denticeps clupeoides]|uniref:DNA repair and recombination protein RAD54B isoform X2 n=1 Tax=Denticeps clupeoides TaxID=299321 RepID=UPI0010A2BB00|nr:DNA repair and recombination protein RAD54B isoform X2 [Denticeps clupeoides]